MNREFSEWLLGQLEVASTRWDYSKVPADFQRDAVRAFYKKHKVHFHSYCIRGRIMASKAETFAEMSTAILKAVDEQTDALRKCRNKVPV